METQNSFKIMFNDFLANETQRLNQSIVNKFKTTKTNGTNEKNHKNKKNLGKSVKQSKAKKPEINKLYQRSQSKGKQNKKQIFVQNDDIALIQIQKDLKFIQKGTNDFNKKIISHYHLQTENELEKTKLEQYKLKNDLQKVSNDSRQIKDEIYEIQTLLQKENDKAIKNQEEFTALCSILNKYLN